MGALHTVVKRAQRKVRIVIGRDAQREKTAQGTMKIITKDRQAPVRKRANIQCETIRMRSRMSPTSVGRATSICLVQIFVYSVSVL